MSELQNFLVEITYKDEYIVSEEVEGLDNVNVILNHHHFDMIPDDTFHRVFVKNKASKHMVIYLDLNGNIVFTIKILKI